MSDDSHPIVRPLQADYLRSLLPPSDALLREMEEFARRREVPISQPEVGRLLEVIAAATRPRTVLELGTAIGYAALRLARGAPEARILTIDRDERQLARARRFFDRAEISGRVELIRAEAVEFLAAFAGPVDLVYLDLDKGDYRRCLDLVLPKLTVGGTLIADNLLWKGRIADPPAGDEDPAARALEAFNGYLAMHPQLRSTILPVGDGVGLAVKTRSLVSEMGGPF